MDLVESKLKQYLSQAQINGVVAIACSAGIDSMVLIESCRKNYPNDQIFCFHLDHSLRKDSKRAADFLEAYCKKHNIKYICKTLKAGEIKGCEQSARKARYQFFEDSCQDYNIKNILLGHNLNDQAETILFRIFRGTNTSGLQGIAQSRQHGSITIHRPLLELSREIITQYAKTQGLDFVEDDSNNNLDFARNRIRNNILPEALKINPKALDNIAQLAQLTTLEQVYIKEGFIHAQSLLSEPAWKLEDFRKLKPIMQRKLLEQYFTPNIAFVNDFMAAIAQGGFHRINFSKDKFFTIKQKEIHLELQLQI
ncbi:MAG: tRNA lysidine(34) synthetase TilS [Cyanobacteria bacterium]|nr:tRNA lysidine(34) synthetase TilS [Cyanobacteriota bacterium]MDA1020168.1 tRNA lysidine(34) synthetase TilS [Cyanobacteriota bacterium]